MENDFFKNNQFIPPMFHHKKSYEPWYIDWQDFNTNAPSYYDYLARFNGFIFEMVEQTNRLLRRNITVTDSKTIDFTKTGDWNDNGNCHNYNDVIDITASVILSKSTKTKNYVNLDKLSYTVKNALSVEDDGLFAPDYDEILKAIDKELGDIYAKIDNLEEQANSQQTIINNLQKNLQKIIDNLYQSGAITTNNNEFVFNTGRNIATGNMNLFGGSTDGGSFIRTNNGKTENDLAGGL